MSQIIGHISQVIGPVVDVYFEGTESDLILPSIHDALEIKRHNGKKLIVEVHQTSFDLFAYRHCDRTSRRKYLHPALQAVGTIHGNRTYGIFTPL